MSVDTIGAIESTVHLTNLWLQELMEELGWRDRQRAYHALRVVLHALRDRLTVAEAVDLGAQLPMLQFPGCDRSCSAGLFARAARTGGRTSSS